MKAPYINNALVQWVQGARAALYPHHSTHDRPTAKPPKSSDTGKETSLKTTV